MENCKHGNQIQSLILQSLHHNQGGTGRHRCPVCAYQLGVTLGLSGKYVDYSSFISNFNDIELEKCPSGTMIPTEYLKITGDNQGGAGRHKCCNCAFFIGFNEGLGIISHIENKSKISAAHISLVNAPNVSSSKNIERSSDIVNNFDYESNNAFLKLLGNFGEDLVLDYERNLSCNLNRTQQIKNIAKEIGDGAGYDILSFDELGNEKYIEVKSTQNGLKTPFYITLNEKNFLLNNDNTFIYRLFNISFENNSAEFYILDKTMIKQLDFIPQVFKVYL